MGQLGGADYKCSPAQNPIDQSEECRAGDQTPGSGIPTFTASLPPPTKKQGFAPSLNLTSYTNACSSLEGTTWMFPVAARN